MKKDFLPSKWIFISFKKRKLGTEVDFLSTCFTLLFKILSAVKKRYASGGKDNDGSTGSLNEGNVIVLPGQQRDSGDIEHLLSAESANTSRVSEPAHRTTEKNIEVQIILQPTK